MKRLPPYEWVYIIQLLLFMLLLREELGLGILLVSGLVCILRIRRIQLPSWVPKILGPALFALTYWENGRSVNPEMGLNILVAVVALKLLEAKEKRDWRMLTLGFFLLWSSGALFVKTPMYFVLAILAVAGVIIAMASALGERLVGHWRDLLVWTMKALPLTVLLFVFLPRFNSGVWTPTRSTPKGVIGFSEEARPSEVQELRATGDTAFMAQLSTEVAPQNLYWRGMTLSAHDGWNWFPSGLDESYALPMGRDQIASAQWIRQEIVHSHPVNRLFALEWGQAAAQGGRAFEPDGNATWRLSPYAQVRHYTVWSSGHPPLAPVGQEKSALLVAPSTGLPKENLTLALARLKRFFERDFSYSLSPGRSTSLSDFLRTKQGWCTHFASAAALMLRSQGHPSRLVSGYLGGELNPTTGHWKVSEDDAHVWIEVWDQERWIRVDPVDWVAPERLLLTGSGFVRQKSKNGPWLNSASMPGWMRDAHQWVEGVNFRFLLWSENFDQQTQRNWAKLFHWELSSFYLAGLWMLGAALLGWWGLEWWRFKARSIPRNQQQQLWRQWSLWWARQGITLPATLGPLDQMKLAQELPLPQRQFAEEWIIQWEKAVYAEESEAQKLESLRRRLRKAP